MPQKDSVHLDDLNAACERFLAKFLRAQLEELDAIDASDIAYAHRARAYLRRYDAASAEREDQAPQGGPRLRLVG